ncbi:2-hydroxyacid dehydrogenase [Govanella unica]|uniref:D-glycerate dehydrogenase n=1 Tax=Govanella unica TaxID=2975056 RepID=A0A9X3Z7F3_9PROT|nr:D-glycerate dehydrogenase [Govania unica]MDA5194102.1 D-glycerate dehydrogenase [Govania unica]
MSSVRRPHVFVTRPLPGRGLERLSAVAEVDVWREEGAPSHDVLLARAAEADGLLCMLTDRIDAGLLDACPRLRVIATCSVGYDHVDLAALTARDIPLGNTPGVLTDATADLAMALMLGAGRRITEAERFLRAGEWSEALRWDPLMFLGMDFRGATLGIAGFGAIGQAVASRARAFGMRVLAWSRSGTAADGVEAVSFERLLAESDVISIHVPLSAETRGLFDARVLAAMKPGAMLINTARGGIVDEAALAAALQTGHLSAAATDVFATEPVAMDSPLLAAPNIIVVPHIGSATLATRSRMADMSVDNLIAGLKGERMPNSPNGDQVRSRR